MSDKEYLHVGVPKQQRLHHQVFGGLNEALALEPTNYPGFYRSPKLPGVLIVEKRTSDIAKFVRNGVMTAGVLADDIVAENGIPGEHLGNIHMDNPANMRFLVRQEDAPLVDTRTGFNALFQQKYPKGNLAAVTSYPHTMLRYLQQKGFLPPELVLKLVKEDQYEDESEDPSRLLKVVEVDGGVESYLRDGMLPSVFAMDIVESGSTAKKFQLEPVLDGVLTVNPSVWATAKHKDSSRVQDTIGHFRENLKGILIPRQE